MTILYGIPNCDTVKKARRWLAEQGVEYDFHDYKKSGIDAGTLRGWCREFGWEALLNRRGSTWRNLDGKLKDNLDETAAIRLMQKNTSVIRRPVLVAGGKRLLGFDEAAWKTLL